jgi:hypothetical protein
MVFHLFRDIEDSSLRPAWEKVLEIPSEPITGCGGMCLSSIYIGKHIGGLWSRVAQA